ncbi:USP domain-containing protein [Balamuthia mandrillaris]
MSNGVSGGEASNGVEAVVANRPSLDDVKKEARFLEGNLKKDAKAPDTMDMIEDWLDAIEDETFPLDSKQFVLTQILPKAVLTLLKRGDYVEEDLPDKVARFFRHVLKVALLTLDDPSVELLKTVGRLFSPTQKNFYLKFGVKLDSEEDMVENSEEESSEDSEDEGAKQSFVHPKYARWESKYLLEMLQYFGRKNGFQRLIDRLKQTPKLRLDALKWIVKIIRRACDFLKVPIAMELIDQLRGIVFNYILSMTDEELKGESRKTITSINTAMNVLLRQLNPEDATTLVDKFDLAISYKLFMSPYLEKRMCGLNDIKRYLDVIIKKEEYHAGRLHVGAYGPAPSPRLPRLSPWLDSEYMLQWLLSKQILEELYVRSPHPELLRRCISIPMFFARKEQLHPSHIDMIYGATIGKHESTRHIIFTTLGELVPVLPLDNLDYLFEKITTLPLDLYDSHAFDLIRAVSIRGINLRLTEPEKKWYGMDIMWDIIQDGSNASPFAVNQAHLFLEHFLQWPNCFLIRQNYMERCVNNLQQQTSVPQSLQLLQKIIETHYEKSTEKEVDTRSHVISWLDDNLQLCSLFFADLVDYKTKAKATAQRFMDTPHDLNEQNLVGCHPHRLQISERLQFLDYILGNSPLTLSTERADEFWSSLITEALTSDERDLAFGWLETARNRRAFPLLSDETTEYIFTKKIPSLDFSALSVKGFGLFEFYFRYMNWKNKSFEETPQKDYCVLSFDLMGLDNMWRVALEAQDEEVGSKAITFLNRLHKTVSLELAPRLVEYREKYLDTCMSHLSEAASKKLDEQSIRRIRRCLLLLKTFLADLEGTETGHAATGKGVPLRITCSILAQNEKTSFEMNSHDTVGMLREKLAKDNGKKVEDVRIITAGKELKNDSDTLQASRFVDQQMIHVIWRTNTAAKQAKATSASSGKTDKNALPSTILSKQEYFELLFGLLNIDNASDIGMMVWELLMSLPTNSNVLHAIETFQDGAQPQPKWDDLLDPLSTFKLLYSLQIVELKMEPAHRETEEETKAKRLWCDNFLHKGGLRHLFHVATRNDLLQVSHGSKRKHVLSLLMKVINFFVIEEQPSKEEGGEPLRTLRANLVESNVDTPLLIEKLLQLSGHAAAMNEPAPEQSAREPDALDAEIVKRCLALAEACCVSHPDTLLKCLLNHSSTEEWFSTVLVNTNNPDIRKTVLAFICRLCDTATCSNADLAHAYFLSRSLVLLPELASKQPQLTTLEQYFVLLNKLVADSCRGTAGGDISKFDELVAKLVQILKEHPTFEQRRVETVDHVLVGVMNLLCTLVSFSVELKQKIGPTSGARIMDEVFHNCLFAIPTIENHGPRSPPKCKTSESRLAAFKLLTELAKDCPTNFAALVALLKTQHHSGDKRSMWKYLPSAFEKAECGYVGLKNLGATCYMNSLLQQFFMVPDFRHGIFQLQDTAMQQELEKQKEGEVGEKEKEATAGGEEPMEEEGKQKEKKKTLEELERESMLIQFQTIFGSLQESEKRYYDTRPFCETYKDWEGQPMNVLQQQDAEEFMNMLLDRLENIAKAQQKDKMLNEVFGGTICNQLISKDCNHVSERFETFFTLSLDIKNKKDIAESLELYVQGDILEGDNKYLCGQCNDKVDALKRCCIKNLPDNLIIHLKRFEFDLEAMKRVKLNEFCQFPMRLNMEPYTLEGLAKKEGTALPEGTEERPASYYEYELAGILVHTGTADFGHYYSFIRERQPIDESKGLQWFQFNDTLVDPFNESEIAACAFGGEESVQEWDSIQGKHVSRMRAKPYNAYMLFYQRVEPLKPPVRLSRDEAAGNVPSRIYETVWKENMDFFVDKHLFDVDYFEFLWDIVKLEAGPSVTDYHSSWDLTHPTMRAIELAFSFIAETLVHAKEKGCIHLYVHQLRPLLEKYLPACRWFVEEKGIKDTSWLEQILFSCNAADGRYPFARLVVSILDCLRPFEGERYEEVDVLPAAEETQMELSSEEKGPKVEHSEPETRPSCLIVRFLQNYLALLEGKERHWKNFAHYFMVLRDFAQLGTNEKKLLLDQGVIAYLIDFYLGEDSPLAKRSKKKKKKRAKMGEKRNPPKLEFMVSLFSELIRACETDAPLDKGTPPSLTLAAPLQLPTTDKELLYSKPFLSKILLDGINSKELAQVLVHICWENEELSHDVLEIITKGLDSVDYDRFQPYFDVLTPLLALEDSLQGARVDQALTSLLVVIKNNLKYKTATYYAVKYLADLVPHNALARDWMFRNKGSWVESWLMANSSDLTREAAESLVMGLVPEAAIRVDPKNPNREILPELTPDADSHLLAVYQYLLSLLLTARRHVRGESTLITGKSPENFPTTYWKLTNYFKLLKWCARSPPYAAVFASHFDAFVQLFETIDGPRTECDLNKLHMMEYWLKMLELDERTVDRITSSPTLPTRLFDFFAGISPNEKMIAYNEEALPTFYRILYLCCVRSEAFMQTWAFHTNLDWATSQIYVNTNVYPRTSDHIFAGIKVIAENIPEYRLRRLPVVLKANKLLTNHRNMLRYYDVLLASEPDFVVFCENQGLQQLARFLHLNSRPPTTAATSASSALKREDPVTPQDIITALKVMFKASSWMAQEPEPDDERLQRALAISEAWEGKTSFVTTLLTIADTYKEEGDVLLECYRLLEVVVRMDRSNHCLEQLLKNLFMDLTSLQDNSSSRRPTHRKPVYFTFASAMFSRALQCFKDDSILASTSASLGVLLLLSTVHLTGNLPKLFAHMEEAWDGSKGPLVAESLRSNLNPHRLQDYLLRVLLPSPDSSSSTSTFSSPKATSPLEDEPCYQFVKKVFAAVMALNSEGEPTSSLDAKGEYLVDSLVEAAEEAIEEHLRAAGGESPSSTPVLHTLRALEVICTMEGGKTYLVQGGNRDGLRQKLKALSEVPQPMASALEHLTQLVAFLLHVLS